MTTEYKKRRLPESAISIGSPWFQAFFGTRLPEKAFSVCIKDGIFIDPASKKTGVDVVEVPGTAIKAADLKSDSTVENLGNIAGETYGNLDYLSEADWMPKAMLH